MKITTVLSATLTMAGFANAKNIRGGRRLAHYDEDGYTKRQQYKRTKAAVEGSMPSDSNEEFTITLDEVGSEEEITIQLDEIDVGGGDVEEEITLKIDLPHERKVDHKKGSDDEEEEEKKKKAIEEDDDKDDNEEEESKKKGKGKRGGKTKDLKGKRKGGKGKGK